MQKNHIHIHATYLGVIAAIMIFGGIAHTLAAGGIFPYPGISQ